MIDYTAVLAALYPGASWTLDGDTYDGLTWLEDSPVPSQAELDAAWPDVAKARRNAAAQKARQVDFAAEADPLFFAWQRGEEDASEQLWLAKVAEVRARHPYEV